MYIECFTSGNDELSLSSPNCAEHTSDKMKRAETTPKQKAQPSGPGIPCAPGPTTC